MKALQISNGVKDSAGRSCRAWIVFAVFRPLHFINDPL